MSKLYFLFISFILCAVGSSLKAQYVNIDSLKEVIENTGSDSATVSRLNKLVNKYRLTNVEASFLCATAAYEKSKQLTYKKIQLEAEYELALIYIDKSNFVQAIFHLTSAEKKAEETHNLLMLMACHVSLGNCYALQKQSTFALSYYQKALDICTRLKLSKKTATILGNMGNLLYEKSTSNAAYLDSAILFYSKAYRQDILNKDTGNTISMLNNMALVYGDKHEYAIARQKLFEVKKLIEITGDMDAKINYYSAMSRVLSYETNFDLAYKYLDSSLQLAKQVGNIERVADYYISKSDVGVEQKDYKTAYECYIKYKDIQDSLLNAENFAQASDFQNQYEREKKQEEIEKLRLRDQNQKIIISAIVLFFLILGVFAFIIYRRLQENRKQKNIIEQQRNEMLDSIHYAKRIQTALLASENILQQNLPDYFIYYKPKDIVSGDFYWACKTSATFIFCLGDCTGHGVPGAFMSLLNISKLNEVITQKKIIQPDLVLNAVRSEIIHALNPNGNEETKDGMDCILCSFDFEKNTMQYAAANNSILIIRNKEFMLLPADRMPVGKSPKDGHLFSLQTVSLQKNDLIYLITDGYIDQFGGAKGKKFKYKQLQETLLLLSDLPLKEQKNQLDKKFEEWKGNLEQIDDVSIVGIKI
jgi:serine phosphatase RsbU (regulator of sigma subunit)/tetratricopeptide (TPR) repeat protein